MKKPSDSTQPGRPSIDYAQAARRHQRAARALMDGHGDEADHLLGFAAECALLGCLRTLHAANA